MRIFFIPIFIIIAICSASAQQNVIDSLLHDLKSHQKEDTVRLELLNKISFGLHQVNPDSGLFYATQQIVLAEKINHRRYEGKGYFNRGINYWAKGMYDRTLSAYKESRTILEQAGTVKNVANLNNSMAVTYQSLSDYPSALLLYFDNLKLFEKLQDTYMIALTCSNIGIVYKYLKQYDKSINFYNKAISINAAAENKKELADNYGNKGNVYEAEGKLSPAIEFYQKSAEISRSIDYIKGVASSNAGLGTAYISSGKYTDAQKPLEEALSVYVKLGDRNNEAIVLKSLGDIYFANPKQYSTAEDYYKKSLSIFNGIENLYGQKQNWQQLALIYEKNGDYKKALAAQQNFSMLRDSIFSDEKKDAVTQMEMRYLFEKKEDSVKTDSDQKIFMASSEIKRQRTIKRSIAWGSGILFAAALSSFIFYKKRRDAKQKQQEAEFKTEVADTEMKALRAQMNPHFIFNSLNAIGDYIAKNNVQEADRYLSKFAKLMRMILENSEQKEVLLTDDLKALELYMELEALRMNNKFSYQIKVDENINKENILVPPLILQPFVENSIWHGIAKKEGLGKILIHIKKEGADMINCIVEDDGIGRKQSANIKMAVPPQEKSSLGVKITQSRIDILNKVKNSKAAVELSDLAQGFRVEVKLPLATNF